MPRPARARTSLPGHSKAAQLKKQQDDTDQDMAVDTSFFAQHEPEPAHVQAQEPGTKPFETTKDKTKPVTRSDKQWAKHQALLQKINASQEPYSKSHARRVRRAQKSSNNLVASLKDVQDELSLVESREAPRTHAKTADKEEMDTDEAQEEGDEMEPESRAKTGGKGQPKLTAKKRSKVLSTESARLPAILANPTFAANPFATIRTHTLNTIAMQKNAGK
ncbi:hypothetical protein ACM66B_003041 [Microbotryomycetes sp. NB124-2]